MDTNCDSYYRKPQKYKGFLMTNEWMIDVPPSLETDYIARPCPVGKRALLVAHKVIY